MLRPNHTLNRKSSYTVWP